MAGDVATGVRLATSAAFQSLEEAYATVAAARRQLSYQREKYRVSKSAFREQMITYSELLPDGRTLAVRATVGAIQVDWGDGFAATHLPGQALPYPEGLVTHTYAVKTCPPEYRETHPSGGHCHPTLEAYPITATFVWTGDYAVGGPWIELGTLPSTVTVAYDVDEVQGVLQS